MKLVETHAHIYADQFKEDRSEAIERAQEIGVSQIYMPNIDHESIDGMLECEDKYVGVCVPTMGLHPCSVKKDFEKELYLVEQWINKREFAAIGEMGLDLYWDKTFFEQQKEAFKIQANWAMEKGWPIIIHSRDSNAELIELLEEINDERLFGVFHCFGGSLEEAQKITSRGFVLGIGGVVTFKNGGLDKVLPTIGIDKLVLETDCPYLAPKPFRGKRNEPAYLSYVLNRVAELIEKSTKEVAEVTTKNAMKLFEHYENPKRN